MCPQAARSGVSSNSIVSKFSEDVVLPYNRTRVGLDCHSLHLVPSSESMATCISLFSGIKVDCWSTVQEMRAQVAALLTPFPASLPCRHVLPMRCVRQCRHRGHARARWLVTTSTPKQRFSLEPSVCDQEMSGVSWLVESLVLGEAAASAPQGVNRRTGSRSM